MNAVFQALSDPTRREILRLLRKREMTAGEIAEHFPLAKSTLSGHFNILKNAGLIVAEKNGTSIVYSLNVSVVEQTMAAVMELFDVGKPTKKGKNQDGFYRGDTSAGRRFQPGILFLIVCCRPVFLLPHSFVRSASLRLAVHIVPPAKP